MNIFWKYLKNDINNSRFLSITTMIMITISVFLLSIAMILSGNLSSAIDSMMELAKTPHFIQMHAGEVNMDQMESFAKQNKQTQAWQVMDFLNIEGEKICINGETLEGSVLDYGCSIQSKKFDFLTDIEGNPVYPKQGEIYLPLCMEKIAADSDTIELCRIPFKIKGFIRDSQMNSELASSVRLLVNEEDLKKLYPLGSIEYLIEFRLHHASDCGTFETEYMNAKLPANGPTITYKLCRLINGLSEGIMIAIILLVCILVTIVSLLCIRFTLLAKLEDDFREIGIMKGIGIEMGVVKKLYLSKYIAITVLGCVTGATASIILQPVIGEDMYHLMGRPKQNGLQYVWVFFGLVLLCLVVLWYLLHLLKRMNHISPREAMNSESVVEQSKKSRFHISAARYIGTNIFLGIKDVLSRKKLYLTMGMIYLVISFLLILPQMLYSTVSDDDFVTYMGVGKSDIQFDLQQTDQMLEKTKRLEQQFQTDPDVKNYVIQYTKVFSLIKKDQSVYNLKIDVGDQTVFPLQYIEGHAPVLENEIAFSSLNMQELETKLGDEVTLVVDGKPQQFKVCGIYQDITNGGKTAKANFPCDLSEVMRCRMAVSLTSKDVIQEKVSQYAEACPEAKVSDVKEFERQTFGVTQILIGKATLVAAVIAFLIIVLITFLFQKLLLIKQCKEIRMLRYSGFSKSEISQQYCTRIVFVLLIGIVVGVLLVNTAGQSMAGIMLSSLGIPKFRFIQKPFLSYVILPFGMVLAAVGAAWYGTRKQI